MPGRVEGKVALVTGGASGIGKAIAERLIQEKARVIVADVNQAAGEALCARLGEGASFTVLDVRNEEEWKAAVALVERQHGRLDVLCNNAGIFRAGTPLSTTLEEFRLHMGVMGEATFLGCKYSIPLMAKTGGSIINMCSTATYLGYPDSLAYGAAKGAMRNITKSVSTFCRVNKYNIRCNSIHPHTIRTPMSEVDGEPLILPKDQFGEPEDVADVVLFLASDEARWINGEEVKVDGGVLVVPPGY